MARTAGVDLRVVHIPVRLHQLLLMVLAGVVLAGAYLTARAGAESRPVPAYTQTWLLWANEAQSEIQLGIQNREGVTRQYQIQLTTYQGPVQEWPAITLAAGESWETFYATPASVTDTDLIKATIYRLDAPQESYREVYLRRVAR
jgi:hypothetical protein